MTQRNDKPQIRFAGFNDAWEQRKFDEVFDCTVPNNTFSRAELSYDEGTVLNVHYGDVLIKYGSVLDVQKNDIPRILHRCREDFNGALLQDGDVIIADTAEDETTGKACEIGNLQGCAVVSGLHTMVCRPRHRMALGYLGYYLNSNAYHNQLLPLMQGIKVLSLSRSNIQKTSVSYPSAMKEQQLIASYFSQLDNLITLHQRKYDKLTNVKKSMLEKMFPQNDANVPEVRFKGFTAAWEQRKLGDNIVEYTEKTTENNQYPVLTSSRKGIFFQTDYYDGNQIASADNTGYNIVPYGYFTYRHMSDDEIFHFNINDIAENGIVSTLYPVFTTDENLDSRYLQYQLNYGREFAKYAILQKQGGSRTYMYLNKLRNLYITVPTTIEEQKKISECFTNLDNLITLHQRELIKLQDIKKV